MRSMILLAAIAASACSVLPRSMRSTAPGPPSADTMAQLWVEPDDIAARDLFLGPGGEEWRLADGAPFTFLAKDTRGYSWGFDLRDERGVRWSAKYGPEAQTEVTISRIVWAVGYHQPPTAYLPRWTMLGSTEVPQASRFRPLPPGWRRTGPWELHRNPFVGSTPFNGLLVLMRIVNNWDLLDRNTESYELPAPRDGAQRWYLIQDLGAALGRTTVVPHSGTRNDIEDFEQQGYIRDVNDDRVVFDDLGRTSRGLFDAITTADVVWISERLDRLTDAQWNDAFRAGGYDPATAQRFIRRLKEKIANGLALRAVPTGP